MAPIDANRLRFRRITPVATTPVQSSLRVLGKGQRFLKGPIPLDWLTAAARLPGRTLHAALALWLEAGFRNSLVVPLSNRQGEKFGLDRNSKYRALKWLEQADLIVVERRLGRAPLITIQAVARDPGDG